MAAVFQVEHVVVLEKVHVEVQRFCGFFSKDNRLGGVRNGVFRETAIPFMVLEFFHFFGGKDALIIIVPPVDEIASGGEHGFIQRGNRG